jgi:hypothetical protein
MRVCWGLSRDRGLAVISLGATDAGRDPRPGLSAVTLCQLALPTSGHQGVLGRSPDAHPSRTGAPLAMMAPRSGQPENVAPRRPLASLCCLLRTDDIVCTMTVLLHPNRGQRAEPFAGCGLMGTAGLAPALGEGQDR